MFRNLFPKSPLFFDFFEQHAQLISESAEVFYKWVSAPQFDPTITADKIKSIEHDADLVAHRCIEALHKTFITPIDREDIHLLISNLDNIIDEIEAAARHIELYHLETMTPEVIKLSQSLQKPIWELTQALPYLRNMQGDTIRVHCENINFYENEMDDLLNTSVATLFQHNHDPILIMKWKEIYEHLESASDRCEDVANILEGIVLEND